MPRGIADGRNSPVRAAGGYLPNLERYGGTSGRVFIRFRIRTISRPAIRTVSRIRELIECAAPALLHSAARALVVEDRRALAPRLLEPILLVPKPLSLFN